MRTELVEVDGETAQQDATRAARAAQVRIIEPRNERDSRLVSIAGDEVWGPGGTLAPNALRALSFSGSPIHLALDEREPGFPVVGFAVGFLGWSPGLHVHSHQVGVVNGHRRRGVGYALKLAQRQTCLSHGITDMRWTFDPLIRRNAAFNLCALGARAASFHPDFYGTMTDSINAGDSTDRLGAVWDLQQPLPTARHFGTEHDNVAVTGPMLIAVEGGRPRAIDRAPQAGAIIAVPHDYEALRRQDAELGRAWRTTLRGVMQAAYEAELRIGAVDELGYHLVDKDND